MTTTRLLLALTLLLPCSLYAQSEDWPAVNRAVMETSILPAYEDFAEAGERLGAEAEGFCEAPEQDGLASMKRAWHAAMDEWQSVQHIRFGPVTYFNWQYRLQYWPDDRGVASRQLDTLLAAEDPAVLETEQFADQSVGVQGLPALEMLLFEDESLSALQENKYRCRVAQAIATNIATIATDMNRRWQEEFRHTLLLENDAGWFSDHMDASTALVKALVETVPLLTDQKLALPMGENAERFRLRRAESWRSARSLRNIRHNVEALSQLFHGDEGRQGLSVVFPDDHVATIAEHVETVQSQLAEMPDGFQAQMDRAQGYAGLSELKANLEALHSAMEDAVKETELYLGFNSLDGD